MLFFKKLFGLFLTVMFFISVTSCSGVLRDAVQVPDEPPSANNNGDDDEDEDEDDASSTAFLNDMLIIASPLVALNGEAYFAASDIEGEFGIELWKTDGTEEGTIMIKDVNLGSSSSNPLHITSCGDKVFFLADDGINGDELWITDGTEEGTSIIEDLNPGVEHLFITSSVCFEGEFFFIASTPDYGQEIYYTSESGTVINVIDLTHGEGGSAVMDLMVFSGKVLFSNQTEAFPDLWVTDGTVLGTNIVTCSETEATMIPITKITAIDDNTGLISGNTGLGDYLHLIEYNVLEDSYTFTQLANVLEEPINAYGNLIVIDGVKVIYNNYNDFKILDLSTMTVSEIVSPEFMDPISSEPFGIMYPHFIRLGDWIYFMASNGLALNLFKVDVDGTQVMQITNFEEMELTPDASSIRPSLEYGFAIGNLIFFDMLYEDPEDSESSIEEAWQLDTETDEVFRR